MGSTAHCVTTVIPLAGLNSFFWVAPFVKGILDKYLMSNFWKTFASCYIRWHEKIITVFCWVFLLLFKVWLFKSVYILISLPTTASIFCKQIQNWLLYWGGCWSVKIAMNMVVMIIVSVEQHTQGSEPLIFLLLSSRR